MTMMVDRNPEGRDTAEGFQSAVQDKSARELLLEILIELKKIRLAMVLSESVPYPDDFQALVRQVQ